MSIKSCVVCSMYYVVCSKNYVMCEICSLYLKFKYVVCSSNSVLFVAACKCVVIIESMYCV